VDAEVSLDEFDDYLLEATGWIVRIGAVAAVVAVFGGIVAFGVLLVRAAVSG
jgi:hypothetical protein